MKTVLEKPKQAVKPQTPFGARKGPPASYPARARCQSIVLGSEREETARIVAEFRENEEIVRLNDVGAFTKEIYKLENPVIGGSDPIRAQQLRAQRTVADHSKCLAALSALNEIHATVKVLAITLLKRLIQSFDDELNQVAIVAEAKLERLGIPITVLEVGHDIEVDWVWSWREVAKCKLQKLDWSGEGLSVCQWMCTDEPGNPGNFSWG